MACTRRCTRCHTNRQTGLDLRAEQTSYFNTAYESLLEGFGKTEGGEKAVVSKYVHPGQARTSPLIWRVFGRNTSRPGDDSYRPGQILPRCPPSGAEPLTDEERVTFVEWIDLGAHWDGIPEAPEPSAGPREAALVSEGIR